MSWDETIARGSEFGGFLKAFEELEIPHGEIEVAAHFAPDQWGGDGESLRKATFTVAPRDRRRNSRELVVEEYVHSFTHYGDGTTHTVCIEVYEVGHRPDLEARKEEGYPVEEPEAVRGS